MYTAGRKRIQDIRSLKNPRISITILEKSTFKNHKKLCVTEKRRKKLPEISKLKVLKKTSMPKRIESF